MARVDQTRARRLAGLGLGLLAVVLIAFASDAGARVGPTPAVPRLPAPLLRNAAAAPTPCGKPTGVLCTRVDVPLDRSGRVGGTISLHVEVLRADGVQRGVMFLIAGGPGQGSAHVFGLGSKEDVAFYRFLFPGYTLVAYDDRGTGDSGLLDCPALQAASTADAQRTAAAGCAAAIGPGRDFYGTADHAEDLDAVRAALGASRVGLYGVSYGTKLAMAYALAHPDHVERLLLDSVLPPELPDPFGADVLRTMPATLAAFCSDGGCRAATGDFAGDVGVVANRLAASPLRGRVTTVGGRQKAVRVDGLDLLSLVLDADLNPGLAAELPAVVKAARAGNTQPLLRLADIHAASSSEPSVDLSSALYAATVCRDGPFPWLPDAPIAQRPATEQAALDSLPPGAFGPFGGWAARFGNADFCLGWPSPAGGATLGAGPLPDVPVLAVSGGFDLRTPTAGAASVVARFPQGRLLVVPGVGHSTVNADFSACAALAVRQWMAGGNPPQRCLRPKAPVAPVPALPAPGSIHAPHAGPAQTFRLAGRTVREAEAAWLMTVFSGKPAAIPGIFGGRLAASSGRTFKLVRYGIARGVWISGTIRLVKFGPPSVFRGTITVRGARASAGALTLSGGSLHGTVGGRVFK